MAKTVEILLRENVRDLGRCGDVVKVAPGYARNFLFPRKMAVTATDDNKAAMMRRRERLEIEEAARTAEVAARVQALSRIELKTAERADENGHLYGSVSASTVSTLLKGFGFEIDEKAVRLDQPIKEVGTHVVRVHVHGEDHADVNITVEAAG